MPATYPKLCGWVEEHIEETLTFYRLPRQHHKHLKSTDEIDKRNCCLTSESTRMAWHGLSGAARRATFDESGEARRGAGQDEPVTGGAPARRVVGFGRHCATKCS
jgi:Transposase, Mutator family